MEGYNRDFKGIWIPKEIWLHEKLNTNEKLFLVEIESLDNEEGCFASNDYFANFFKLSKNRCSEIIKSLESKGLIVIQYIYRKNSKSIEKRIIKVIRKIEYGYSESRQTYSKNRLGYSENSEDNNTSNNTINIKEKRKKKTDIDILIEGYTDDNDLRENIYEFIKMRKAIKKPITDEGLRRILKKLDNLTDNKEDKIEILGNSIMNSWQGIFPIKKENEEKLDRESMYSN